MILTCENQKMMDDLAEVLLEQCQEGEYVITRRAFRWYELKPGKSSRDVHSGWSGRAIPNAYKNYSAESAANCLQGVEVVHNFGHLAIVRTSPKTGGDAVPE